jgi:hypothetical protein
VVTVGVTREHRVWAKGRVYADRYVVLCWGGVGELAPARPSKGPGAAYISPAWNGGHARVRLASPSGIADHKPRSHALCSSIMMSCTDRTGTDACFLYTDNASFGPTAGAATRPLPCPARLPGLCRMASLAYTWRRKTAT